MPECEIAKVDSQDSMLTPKIVNFQNGQPNNTKQLKCESFIDAKSEKSTMAIASDRLMYVGEVNDNDLFYSLLALRNKKTNKVRIVPLHSVQMNVCMLQNDDFDNTMNSSTVGALYKQFGSKKSIRITEQYERMRMNVSNVEEELKSTVANVTIKEEDLVTPGIDENVVDYRPKINRNASTVEKVYNLYEIIDKNDLDSLKDIANKIVEHSVIEEQLSEFVLDCVNKLKQESVTDLKKYEILLYCDAILKFFKIKVQNFTKARANMGPYPENIRNKIYKEFTVLSDNRRNRPLSMRDKAICHIIVLALIAMNYKLNLEFLPISMSVAIKKLSDISRVLGAQPLSSKNKTTIVLKLPLPAPATARRAKKKKT